MTSVLNKTIDALPFELHIPTYRFCGPGTKLDKRIHQQGKNPLDEACKEHDIAYHNNKDLKSRHEADLILANKAFQRFKSKDALLGERIAALGVSGAMHTKRTLGFGKKKKRNQKKRNKNLTFHEYIKTIGGALKSSKNITIDKAAQLAYKTALRHRNKVKNPQKRPRIITIPKKKTGGILPLLAGLGALGSLIGGASAIANTVKKARAAEDKLVEMKRHNAKMENIAIGKGLYLKPYKSGAALFIKQEKNLKEACRGDGR